MAGSRVLGKTRFEVWKPNSKRECVDEALAMGLKHENTYDHINIYHKASTAGPKDREGCSRQG